MSEPETPEQEVIKEADRLFDQSNYDELLKLLKSYEGTENCEPLLWRLARCEFQIAKKTGDKVKHAQLIEAGFGHVQKSLQLNDKNGSAHKWAAILLNASSSLKGLKEKISQVLNVRNHMEKAIEYNPTDSTSYYLLGEWHYSCCQVGWIERKMASVLFGSLPDASMKIAKEMFEKAEEIEPDFYAKNKLMLAKTLLDSKIETARAVALLEEVVDKYRKSTKWDDIEAVDEAEILLTRFSKYKKKT